MNQQPQPDSPRDSLANLIHSKPRDVFIYLLVIIMLYTSVYELLTLLFDYVNIGFPDPLESSSTSSNRFGWRSRCWS